jgi:hypothetical protein
MAGVRSSTGAAVGARKAAEQQLKAQLASIQVCVAPVQYPWDAQAEHVPSESEPEQAAAPIGVRGSIVTGAVVGGGAAAKQQLRAQLASIQACAAPLQYPWAAQVAHKASESVREQAIALAGVRGAAGGMGTGVAGLGAAVREGKAVVLEAQARLQLRAQLASMNV